VYCIFLKCVLCIYYKCHRYIVTLKEYANMLWSLTDMNINILWRMGHEWDAPVGWGWEWIYISIIHAKFYCTRPSKKPVLQSAIPSALLLCLLVKFVHTILISYTVTFYPNNKVYVYFLSCSSYVPALIPGKLSKCAWMWQESLRVVQSSFS